MFRGLQKPTVLLGIQEIIFIFNVFELNIDISSDFLFKNSCRLQDEILPRIFVGGCPQEYIDSTVLVFNFDSVNTQVLCGEQFEVHAGELDFFFLFAFKSFA